MAKSDIKPLTSTEHTAIGDSSPHHVKYTDAEAVTAVEAEDPLELTGELDITGAGACIDLNPAHTAGGNIIDITPTAAQASGTWHGLDIDGSALDPSAATTIKGLNVDMRYVNLANNPALMGAYIGLPATYGGGLEIGLEVQGDGRKAQFCTDVAALNLQGDMTVTGGNYYSTNTNPSMSFTMYNNVNNGHPLFVIGSSGTNKLQYRVYYNAGTQEINYVDISTVTTSADATNGNIRFSPDATETFRVQTAADTEQATVTGHLKVTGDLTDGTDALSMAELADLLMYGSANAAWVPCVFTGANTSDNVAAYYGYIRNAGVAAMQPQWKLTTPTLKGALKLYINGIRYTITDADANNYVDEIRIRVWTWAGASADTYTDGTNRVAAAEISDTFAAVDMSTYGGVYVWMTCINNAGSALDITNMSIQCYYDT